MSPKQPTKHVLFLPSWYPDKRLPHNGTFFREQAHMLRSAGYRVGVVAIDAPLLPLRWDLRLKVTEEDGITVIRSKLPQVMWRGFPGDATIARVLSKRALKKYEELRGKPDIVHAHSVFPGIYTAQTASKIWDVPYVLTEHRPSSLDRPINSRRGRSIAKAVREADGRSVVSAPFAELLAKYYGVDDWQVIPLPVLDSQSKQPLPKRVPGQPFTFCHVSHWDSNKRVELTMKAFAKAHAKKSDIRLTLIGGTGKTMEKIKSLRSELGLSKEVTLLPRQPRERIAELMSQGHAFVLASEVEAGGTVFAEAQMSGLPCIGTRTFAGQFMIEEETGIRISIDDEAALTNAMVTLAEDDHRRYQPAKIRQRARERFSEQTFVNNCSYLYEKARTNFRPRG